MEQQEIALIRKAQRGDTFAFENLIRKYDKQVLNLALNMVGNIEDAKDIYQEVFIRAYRSLRNFRFQSEFFTWLYRITVNYSINFRKKRSSRAALHLEANEGRKEVNFQEDEKLAPDKTLERNEFHYYVKLGLEYVSAQQRSIFVLRHFNDYKLSEIAEILDCQVGTVKNQLFRATQKIKKYLQSVDIL